MKSTKRWLLAISIFALPVASVAQTRAPECQGITINTKAVALGAPKVLNPVVDFTGSGGQLDPTPLLQTEIEVQPGRPTCVVVHFSVQVDPQDNWAVFQASMDDTPMAGHGPFYYFPSTPVVADPEETNLNLSRMRSYTFFAAGTPGKHTIKIRIASCCTSNPTGGLYVRGASLVVGY